MLSLEFLAPYLGTILSVTEYIFSMRCDNHGCDRKLCSWPALLPIPGLELASHRFLKNGSQRPQHK
jgi:hypothetical protein